MGDPPFRQSGPSQLGIAVMKRYTIDRLLVGAILGTALLAYPATALARGKDGRWEVPKGPVKHTNQDNVPPNPPDPPPPPPGGLFHGPGIDPALIDFLFGHTVNPFGDELYTIKTAPLPPAPPEPPLEELLGGPLDDVSTLPRGLIRSPLAPKYTPVPPPGKFDLFTPGTTDARDRPAFADRAFGSPIPAPGAISLITLGVLSLIGRRRRRTVTA